MWRRVCAVGSDAYSQRTAAPSRDKNSLVQMSAIQSQSRADEAQLIKRVCEGEREVFYELVRPYERMVYATASSIVKNPADAEEVAQEAVLKAFSKLSSFRGESKFSTWLVQITYNEAKMKLRKAHANLYESIDDSQQTENGEFWPKDYADWRPIPSELLEENEIRQAVQDAISSLSANYREVLILRDVQRLSIKETTTILGISEPNVKTRLHRARLLLRDSLAPGIDGSWIQGQPYRKARAWGKKKAKWQPLKSVASKYGGKSPITSTMGFPPKCAREWKLISRLAHTAPRYL